MRKRHRYVTVIVNGDTGHTLAMVEHRSSAGLTGFLMSQPHSWRRSVKVVVSDGSNAYKASIQTCLPQARHVLDRFHIIRWFTAGLTAVRREIQRRNNGTKPVAGPQVFCARFLLLRRGDTLTDTDQARLDKLFDAHPRLKTGWQALQELHGLYLADEHDGALEALDRFCDLYKTGELPEFENIVDTIINWSDEILAWHLELALTELEQTRIINWSDEILAWHHTGRPSNGRIKANQQPPTNPRTNRTRIHQPHQLPSPRIPDNMTTNPTPATQIPRLRAGTQCLQTTGLHLVCLACTEPRPWTPVTAWGDLIYFLDIKVHQFTWRSAFIAAYRLTGGPVDPASASSTHYGTRSATPPKPESPYAPQNTPARASCWSEADKPAPQLSLGCASVTGVALRIGP
ncbi:MAG: transposase [Acidimicrobiia bacterium]|nr:transposase [Acidimicrobiia bacterium]